MRVVVLGVLVAACANPSGGVPDAPRAPDAASDARAIDWAVPWARHTITRVGESGADGVRLGDANGDGFDDVVSGWEEGGGVTLSLHPAVLGGEAWPTVRLSPLVTGYEDAMIADVDGDGHPDVIGACECNRLTVWFAPSDPAQLLAPGAWTAVELAGAVGGSHRFMQLAFADVDGDGRGEILFGTRVGAAIIGYVTVPAAPRTAAAWAASYHLVSAVGWTMSLIARDVDGDGDVDLIVSDRAAIGEAWDLFGTRWLEHRGGAWVNHTITGPEGNGEPKLLWVGDFDGDGRAAIVEPRGDNSAPGGVPYANSVRILRNSAADWSGAWSIDERGDTPDVGTVQSAAAGDLDGDGRTDVALGYSYGHDTSQPTFRDATASNLVWLAGGDSAAQRPLLGNAGLKVDNTVLADVDGDGDLDIVQSEQGDAGMCGTCMPPTPTPAIDQLGVFWLENPR